MLYLYWILVFLKNILDYEKVNVRIQVLKRHKLHTLPPKRRSEVFRSKIDLGVAPKNGSKNELSEMSLDLQASYPLLFIKRNFLEFF